MRPGCRPINRPDRSKTITEQSKSNENQENQDRLKENVMKWRLLQFLHLCHIQINFHTSHSRNTKDSNFHVSNRFMPSGIAAL